MLMYLFHIVKHPWIKHKDIWRYNKCYNKRYVIRGRDAVQLAVLQDQRWPECNKFRSNARFDCQCQAHHRHLQHRVSEHWSIAYLFVWIKNKFLQNFVIFFFCRKNKIFCILSLKYWKLWTWTFVFQAQNLLAYFRVVNGRSSALFK